MYIKPAHWSDLPKGNEYRPLFKLARIAVGNTIMGGCSALTMAKRAQRMGLPSARDMLNAVSNVYASSSGKVPADLHPWECAECGQIYVLAEDAASCCAFQD